MTWNYRIIHHEEGHYSLHEVYYDDDGKPKQYTIDPISFVADKEEGSEGIIQSLKMALKDATERSIIDVKEFECLKK